jgi:prephenate dehydratase/prephenate dehydrogenase
VSAPPALVVVGAALGTGRWLVEHLMPHAPWSSVTLIDSKTTRTTLGTQTWRIAESGVPLVFGESVETADGDRVVLEGTLEALPLPTGPTVVWFALPPAVLPGAIAEMLPLLDPASTVIVSASPLEPALAAVRAAAGGRAPIGVHALFDASMPSLAGQILYVVPEAPEWLADAAAHAGGIIKSGSALEHDRAMELVQSLAHRVLVGFADDVTASGLDLERDIWEARTPLFETLFGLAVRVLDSRATTVSAEDIARIQARFPGALYDTIRGTAAAAVAAAQAKRLAFAALWRSGELVGIGASVGRIVDLTPTTVTIENALVGPAGRGVLLTGPGAQNAAALGVAGAPKRVTLALSHAEPLVGNALSELLDARLAVVRRDVRFLVPESVAGIGVLRIVAGTPGLRGAELRDEVVRTGQRAVVLRVLIRADYDAAALVADLQQHVAEAYRWPEGLARGTAQAIERVAYLGPAGTFSEDAAGLAARAVGAPDATLVALDSFDDVLAALGPDALGVVPITSSASGLVSRTVGALLGARGGIVAGGMVDVAVRFDAYARPGMDLEALRGAPVYSHPQALAQCTAFVRRWGLDPHPVASTALALELAASAEIPSVALAGAGKGVSLGLAIAEREVDDLSGSITRFLVVGRTGAFGELGGGSVPTLRRVWIGSDLADALLLLGGGAGFDELLTDADGRWLLVSSRESDPAVAPGATLLGDVPWSPRTPVVRA